MGHNGTAATILLVTGLHRRTDSNECGLLARDAIRIEPRQPKSEEKQMVCDISPCRSVAQPMQQRFCPHVSQHESRQAQICGLALASGFGFGFGKARVLVTSMATAAMSVAYFIVI